MTITKEQTSEVTATIKMEISPDDYREPLEKVVLDYKKKANIPGFRPGHVPVGLIRKMYGKALLAEEINKILSEGLTNYLQEQKLQILGSPLPNTELNGSIDFDRDTSFTFFFDLGLTPKFTIPLNKMTAVDQYLIQVDDTLVEKHIMDYRSRYGSLTHPESVGKDDIIHSEVIESDATGTPLENGIRKEVHIVPDRINNTQAQNRFLGMVKGEMLTFQPLQLFSDSREAALHLTLKEEQVSGESTHFSLTVKDIMHMELAEMNQGFFAQVFPGENIEMEEDFRERIRKDIIAGFTAESDKLLFRKATKTLVEVTDIVLPDEFLKRWFLLKKQDELTPEDIEKEVVAFIDYMKWRLIVDKIIFDYNIMITDEDIRNYIRIIMIPQLFQKHPESSQISTNESLVDMVMQKKEQVQRISDLLYQNRLLDLFKQHMTMNRQEISYLDYIRILSEEDSQGQFDYHIHHENHEHHEHS